MLDAIDIESSSISLVSANKVCTGVDQDAPVEANFFLQNALINL